MDLQSSKANADEYETFSTEQHIRDKDMWAGTQSKTTIDGLCGVMSNPVDHDAFPDDEIQYKLVAIDRNHTPALLKIIDECLVNSSDHAMEHKFMKRKADRVSYINASINPDTGEIVIENDGPGIPVIPKPGMTHEDRVMCVPEIAFTVPFTGRNMNKRETSIKGGVNGIGAKIGNIHSAKFKVLTVGRDEAEKFTLFVQEFSDGMRKRTAPFIARTTNKAAKEFFIANPEVNKKSNTRLTFTPDYKHLGYTGVVRVGSDDTLTTDYEEIESWARWRMYLLAAYVGKTVKVAFNGVLCQTNTAKALINFIHGFKPDAVDMPIPIFTFPAKATVEPYNLYNWDIAVSINPANTKFVSYTVINGVRCTSGNHIKYFRKMISDSVNAHIKKIKASKTGKNLTFNETCKYLTIVIVGALPGAKWDAQNKESLQVTMGVMNQYTIPDTKLKQIGVLLAELTLSAMNPKKVTKKRKVVCEKYTPADKAGSTESMKCSLIAAEGDSAISLIRAGLVYGDSRPASTNAATFKYYGIMSLGGVIMNAMKKTVVIGDRIIQSDQLQKNKVLMTMVEVLGLNFNCKYETEAEMKTLRYGAIIIATDQDLDGTGKILPLVLVWFHHFWPNLIANGFVKRYMTPVIRIYTTLGNGRINEKILPKEFYYENEFSEWLETEAADGSDPLAGKEVTYYKGLASHDTDEVIMMFNRFHEDIYTFSLDVSDAGVDRDDRLFEIYFGKDANLRKIELSTPVDFLSIEDIEEIQSTKIIPCDIQLNVDAKAYKHDDIERKIPSALTGCPVARTKILYGAMKILGAKNKKQKVFQLGGSITKAAFYHHGDKSLNDTVIKMAQQFPGSNRYPFFTKIGQFGTRMMGGADAGASRYINIRLAKPFAMSVFPAADEYLLPYVFEDGERAQPRHYVPVIPVSIIESSSLPSEGWKHVSYARDIDDIFKLMYGYFDGDPLVLKIASMMEQSKPGTQLIDLVGETLTQVEYTQFMSKYPLSTCIKEYGHKLSPERRAGLLRDYKGHEHSFGDYDIDAKGNIVINELPINVPTSTFIKSLDAKERAPFIADIEGKKSSDFKINIIIKLKPGSGATIERDYGDATIDPYEDFLNLRKSTKPLLNYFKPGGGVIEFGGDYHSIFFYWLPFRRNLYAKRFERTKTQLELKIVMEENIIKYIENPSKELIKEADDDSASLTLTTMGLLKFDHVMINTPRFTPVDEINERATVPLETPVEVQKATHPKVTHDYILNLRERDLVKSAKVKRLAAIEKLRETLKDTIDILSESPFPCASVWRAETKKVVAALAKGKETKWKF